MEFRHECKETGSSWKQLVTVQAGRILNVEFCLYLDCYCQPKYVCIYFDIFRLTVLRLYGCLDADMRNNKDSCHSVEVCLPVAL